MLALGSSVFRCTLFWAFYAVFCLALSPTDAPDGISQHCQDGPGSRSDVISTKELFRFHPRGARNIIVSDDGRAVYRRMNSAFGHTAALTSRTLNPGEVFEVWVDSLEYVEHPRIGITTQTPDKINYPDYMNHLSEGTWGWDVWPNQIYQDGDIIKEPYTQGDREIQRGDRYGVSVTDGGTLHFHHNGRDLGAAAENVVGNFYAYVDLYWQGSNATIAE